MPSVSYDGQSFQVNGRRIWLCGASIPYALVPPQDWKAAIAAVAEAGFNTVETAAPWLQHEPRPGRFQFEEGLDLRRFIELCGEAGLRVLLRVGPYIGGTIDGGGLPGWLAEIPGMALRQGAEPFLERVSQYFHRLFNEVVDLQATRPSPGSREGGPLLLVQIEHGWHCANDEQGRKYLQELVRYVRECGVSVPLLSANDLWQDVEGTIETWTGSRDLLVNLRQLRAVQLHAPRLVTSFDPGGFELWGADPPAEVTRETVLFKLGQIFAAGGQPFIAPFHPGANFGYLGGRLMGGPDRYVTTRAAVGAPLDEAGRRGPKYAAVKRLVSFATAFGHVFAELDPDYHPIAIDMEGALAETAPARSRPSPTIGVVPLRGPQGRVVFVFAGPGAPRDVTLLLENGIRMPVQLGDQPVGWYVLDVDLLGNGKLDFCNLCPAMLVDRSILVVQGPAKAPAYLSINGGPLEAVVPSGAVQPLVVDHKGITVVICNQQQIDATYHDGEFVYVGCAGFGADGRPIQAPGFSKVWRVAKGGEVKAAPASPTPKAATPPSLAKWKHARATSLVTGASARYATLDGPASLVACGATSSYGWYRLRIPGTRGATARKRAFHMVGGGDRLHLYRDGVLQQIVGTGPGATPPPFELKLGPQEITVALLADSLGRFAEGNDAGERKGLPYPIYEITPLKGVKIKEVEAPPADPFKLRGFIANRAAGQLGSTTQVQWSFIHRRKSPLLVHLQGLKAGGTLVLNNVPLAYYAGANGAMSLTVLIDPATTKGFKPGGNALRFSPDPVTSEEEESPRKALAIYEAVRDLGADAHWGFARWETPPAKQFTADSETTKGQPCWWSTTFETPHPAPLWLSTAGLSKGVALLNGIALGRYFTATASGKAVGPQTTLYMPAAWQRVGEPNELVIFDEHGFAPSSVRIVAAPDRS